MKKLSFALGALLIGIFSAENLVAQVGTCPLYAPESCYYVRAEGAAYPEGWLWNSDGGNTEAHCSLLSPFTGTSKNEIDFGIFDSGEVCEYMKKDKGYGAISDCGKVTIDELQNIIRPYVQKNSAEIWPSKIVTEARYQNYHEEKNLKKILNPHHWRTSSQDSLDCDERSALFLRDGKYGYCTRYAFQLYLDQDCLTPDDDVEESDEIIIGGEHNGNIGWTTVFDEDDEDNRYDENGNVSHGLVGITYREDRKEICEREKYVLVFNTDGTPIFENHGKSFDTKDICEAVLGQGQCEETSNVLDAMKAKISAENSDAVYLDEADDFHLHEKDPQTTFEVDLSKYMTEYCTPPPLIIGGDYTYDDEDGGGGGDEDGDDETPEDGKSFVTFEEDDESSYERNGHIQMCIDGKIEYKILMFDGTGESLAKFKPSATEYSFDNFVICQKLRKELRPDGKTPLLIGGKSCSVENIKEAVEAKTGETYVLDGQDYRAKLENYESNHTDFEKDLSEILSKGCEKEKIACTLTDESWELPSTSAKTMAWNQSAPEFPYWKWFSADFLFTTTFAQSTSPFQSICDTMDLSDCSIGNIKAAMNQDKATSPLVWNFTTASKSFGSKTFTIPASFQSDDILTNCDAAGDTVKTSNEYGACSRLAISRYMGARFCKQPDEKCPDPETFEDKSVVNNYKTNCGDDGSECAETWCDCEGQGLVRNEDGTCGNSDFFDWDPENLRPKYLTGSNWDDRGLRGDASDFTFWIQKFGGKLTNFIPALAVLFIAIAAATMSFSGGSTDEIGNAKKALTWIAIGLIILPFLYVLTKTVISLTY